MYYTEILTTTDGANADYNLLNQICPSYKSKAQHFVKSKQLNYSLNIK